MAEPQSVLDLARQDAQELHKKISANISRAEHATWSDIKDTQADVKALAVKMKTLAEDQADSAKAAIKAAIEKMNTAAAIVEDKAFVAKDGINHANIVMLDSVYKAAHSLSSAIAEGRSKLARAIEPKKVPA